MLRATPDSKPTSMPPAEFHNSTSEIAWRIQKSQPVTGQGRASILNNSSFGQHEAGRRNETICIGVRRLREKGAHVLRRVEEASESGVRSGFGEAGSPPEGGGRSEAQVSPITVSTGEPQMIVQYSSFVPNVTTLLFQAPYIALTHELGLFLTNLVTNMRHLNSLALTGSRPHLTG